MSKFPTDELVPCMCGFKPDHYEVNYGPTPYIVFCHGCKRGTNFTLCEVSGSPLNIIDYWNNHVANKTKEELRAEVVAREKAKLRLETKNEQQISSYEYYWIAGKGKKLYVKYKW